MTVGRHNSIPPVIIDLSTRAKQRLAFMFRIMAIVVRTLSSSLRSRSELVLENMVLRQQLAAFKARGRTPRIRAADRAFWVLLRRLEHGGQLAHFNVTEHSTAAWVIQQLREAFPYDSAPNHLIFDRDSIFAAEVVAAIRAMGIKPARTAYRSPWQNGTAERWVGACRQELLDHVIILGEVHLRRLLREYAAYRRAD